MSLTIRVPRKDKLFGHPKTDILFLCDGEKIKMNKSREQYLLEKLTVKGECECDVKGLERGWCGYCWYNGVTCWNPPECEACLKDTYTFREALKKANKGDTIKITPKCCRWCIWWDWFHAKRISEGKAKLIRIEYKNK